MARAESAARRQFVVGPARVTIDEGGHAIAVQHADRPDLNYLRPPTDVGGLAAWAWRTVAVRADEDEVEIVRHCFSGPYAGVVQCTIRHSFAPGWSVRVAWVNEGSGPVTLDDPALGFRAGPGCLAWGLAAGEDAGCAVVPLDGGGPLLGGRLRRGFAQRLDAAGLTVSSATLAPGQSLVLRWEWDWHATPAAYGRGRHAEVPWALTAHAGEPLAVPAGPDAVLLVDGQPAAEDAAVVQVDGAGISRQIELRSAAGTTRYRLEWAPSVDDLLDEAVGRALAGDRSPTGVPRLRGVEQALLVQQALRRGRCPDPLLAEDALDAFAAAHLERPVAADTDPLLAVFWCGEYARSGDPDHVEAAEAVLAAQDRVRPGLGVAGLQTLLTSASAGRSASAVRHRLAALAAAAGEAGERPTLADLAARLELRAGLVDEVTEDDLRRLGTYLGAGLKGRPAEPPSMLERAHAVAVIEGLPEAVSARVQPAWECSLVDLARREAAVLTAELARALHHDLLSEYSSTVERALLQVSANRP